MMGAPIPKLRVIGSARGLDCDGILSAVGRVERATFYCSLTMASDVARFEPDARPTQARCAYCGRYGSLGRCEGCGANNEPFRLE